MPGGQGQTSACASRAAPEAGQVLPLTMEPAHTEMGFKAVVCSSGQGRAELVMCSCEETHPGRSPKSHPRWKGDEQPSPGVPAELQVQLNNNFS